MTNVIAGTTATQEEARVLAATLEEPHNETREMPHAATREVPPSTTREEPQPQIKSTIHPVISLEPPATTGKEHLFTTKDEPANHK